MSTEGTKNPRHGEAFLSAQNGKMGEECISPHLCVDSNKQN